MSGLPELPRYFCTFGSASGDKKKILDVFQKARVLTTGRWSEIQTSQADVQSPLHQIVKSKHTRIWCIPSVVTLKHCSWKKRPETLFLSISLNWKSHTTLKEVCGKVKSILNLAGNTVLQFQGVGAIIPVLFARRVCLGQTFAG